VILAKRQAQSVEEGKKTLKGIVSMLDGLIKSNSAERVHEGGEEYGAGEKEEQD
jgi:hypothetical protein